MTTLKSTSARKLDKNEELIKQLQEQLDDATRSLTHMANALSNEAAAHLTTKMHVRLRVVAAYEELQKGALPRTEVILKSLSKLV